jgi:uncharacterized protein
LAEQFSENAEVRQRLREIMQRTGVVASTRIAPEPKPATAATSEKTEKPMPKAKASSPRDSQTASPDQITLETIVAVEADGQSMENSTATAASTSEAIHSVDSLTAEPAENVPVETGALPDATAEETHTGEAIATEHAAIESGTAVSEHAIAPPADSAAAESVHAHATGEQAVSENTEDLPPEVDSPEKTAEVKPVDEKTLAEASVIRTPSVETPVPGPTPSQKRQKERQLAKQQAQEKREQMKKRQEEKRVKSFRDYFDYREDIKRIPPHRVLALNRGEKVKILRVKIETDLQAMVNAVEEMFVPVEHPHAEYLRGCARDSLTRLILPGLERETRRELTERAELHAVDVFAKNLRNLLLQPPIRDRRVLALDPGFKSGCKYTALDQFGNLLEHGVIFLIGNKPDRREQSKLKIVEVIKKYEITVVAIGNGTACREVESFVASDVLGGELTEQGVSYVIVNEAGASVYSTSSVGREEFPEYDATLRGAISIGRRLQDPLSELVKIEPANIGVGLYQHDVKAKHLTASLDGVVESCVNFVGVDVNMASPALLSYVSGLNQLTARRLYEYRREHGPFRTREQLQQVPGLGEATFVQAAGFLKIPNGDNPLDGTWIHPESYEVAGRLLERLSCTPADLSDKAKVAELAERIGALNIDELAAELQIGALTLKDMLAQFVRPGRDPREDLPQPVFKHGILKLEDLAAGMELTGTVLNVVDFGCFVDIGMHDSGLVHVSHLADRFIRDPHEVVSVGDVVKVWVLSVDKERRRVSLTMVQPGSERPRPPRRQPRGEGQSAGGATAEGAPSGDHQPQEQGQGGRPPRRDRAPRPGGRPQGQGDRPQGERPQGERPQGDRPQGGHSQGDRPPRQGGYQGGQGGGRPSRYGGGQRRGAPDRPHGPYEAKAKPKPVVPLTDEMKKGKKPLRTFGDLLQFYELKQEPSGKPRPAPKEQTPPSDEVTAKETSAAPAEEISVQEASAAPVEEVAAQEASAAPVEKVAIQEKTVEQAPPAEENKSEPSPEQQAGE